MKKLKSRYFKCGQNGHWKKDCPKLGTCDFNVVEACLVENYNDEWIIDSESTYWCLLLFAVVQTKQLTM